LNYCTSLFSGTVLHCTERITVHALTASIGPCLRLFDSTIGLVASACIIDIPHNAGFLRGHCFILSLLPPGRPVLELQGPRLTRALFPVSCLHTRTRGPHLNLHIHLIFTKVASRTKRRRHNIIQTTVFGTHPPRDPVDRSWGIVIQIGVPEGCALETISKDPADPKKDQHQQPDCFDSTGASIMARKTTLQPLTLPEATNVGDNSDYQLDSPTSRSPFSQKSPRSPRSPFKFTTKKSHQNVDHPYIQGTEAQTSRQLAYSQTVPSLSTQQYTDSYRGQDQEEARERGGFFSNYKASKSSSRLQQATASLVRQEGEDNMSRDTDRPTMGGKVSSGESNRSGTTYLVSSLLSDVHDSAAN